MPHLSLRRARWRLCRYVFEAYGDDPLRPDLHRCIAAVRVWLCRAIAEHNRRICPDFELCHTQRSVVNALQCVSITSHLALRNIGLNEFASAATDLSQEEPPVDFRVDFTSKAQARTFGRIEFLNTMVLDMAAMAVMPWNDNLFAHKFPAAFQIAVGFVCNRSGPGLMVKQIMWALEKIFEAILDADSYLSGNAVVYLGSTTLGVGNVYAVIRPSGAVNTSDARTGHLADGNTGGSILTSTLAPPNETVSHADSVLIADKEGNSSPVDTLPLGLITSASGRLNSTEADVQIHFWYREHAAPVDDAQVYNSSIKLILKAAEPEDIDASIWPGIATYNVMNDFTLTVRPAGVAHRTDVSWWDTIFLLSTMPVQMSRVGGVPGMFAELDGTVQIDEVTAARFCIDKGDKTGVNPQDMCTRPTPNSGIYGYGLAVA